jgi:predicted RNase H-like nuclease
MSGLFGVDGCSGGWIAASVRSDSTIHVIRVARLTDLPAPTVIAVDMPIGLPDRGDRACDAAARKLIGIRRSSVFPVPIRGMMSAATREAACAIGRETDGREIGATSWAIKEKIETLDQLLRSNAQFAAITYEVHPEVIFHRMSGGVGFDYKKTLSGAEQRLSILETALGSSVRAAAADARALGCARDDVIDSMACLWTARRIAAGHATSLPEFPPTDALGLPMRIVS